MIIIKLLEIVKPNRHKFSILTKYGNGVPYIETEWRGSPMLDLGERLTSFSLKDPSEVRYECLSNDMSYDGGLKVKTKARKITVPRPNTEDKG